MTTLRSRSSAVATLEASAQSRELQTYERGPFGATPGAPHNARGHAQASASAAGSCATSLDETRPVSSGGRLSVARPPAEAPTCPSVGQSRADSAWRSWSRNSPDSGIAASSTVRAVWCDGARACFPEIAGVAGVLAGGPIRGDLQAHLAGPSCGGAVTEAYARGAAGGDKWRSVCGDRRHPVTDGQAQARVEAEAFRRRRTRRRRPPPSSRTDRSQWTPRAILRSVVV